MVTWMKSRNQSICTEPVNCKQMQSNAFTWRIDTMNSRRRKRSRLIGWVEMLGRNCIIPFVKKQLIMPYFYSVVFSLIPTHLSVCTIVDRWRSRLNSMNERVILKWHFRDIFSSKLGRKWHCKYLVMWCNVEQNRWQGLVMCKMPAICTLRW
jgi:hypothetical protein